MDETLIDPFTQQPIASFLYAPVSSTGALLLRAVDIGVAQVPENGLVLEFGVGRGWSTRTIRQAAKGAEVYGFDSFNGLPQDWQMSDSLVWRKGAFGTEGKPPEIKGVTFVQGLFADTIPQFKRDHQNRRIAYLGLDCDLYESAKTVLSLLDDIITVGTVIYFDEICDWGGGDDRYPNWPHGEYRAFCEWIQASRSKVEVIGRNNRYGAAVRIIP
jgi:hypothetical protein